MIEFYLWNGKEYVRIPLDSDLAGITSRDESRSGYRRVGRIVSVGFTVAGKLRVYCEPVDMPAVLEVDRVN